MGQIVEKNNWGKSLLINDVIKIFALEKKISSLKKITSLSVYTSNISLIKCLKLWSKERCIEFKGLLERKKKEKNNSIKAIYKVLPHMFREYFGLRIIPSGIEN